MGYATVAEAATDIILEEQAHGIAEPWRDSAFPRKILEMQWLRQGQAAASPSEIQFFDRAPLDTWALCLFLGMPIPVGFREEIARVQEAGAYEKTALFVENLGSCEPTAARRISFEDSLRFERVHEEVYREWGYRCLRIPAQSVEERAQTVLRSLSQSIPRARG
jgi:predicted ATPase